VPTLFTIGYEGVTPDGLVATLRSAGVDRVIDVRALPLSRRRGFSKTSLAEHLGVNGIEYVHLRIAGNPYRARPTKGLSLFRRHLARSPEVIRAVRAAMRGHRAALLCVEHDAGDCHRSIIAEMLGVPTTNL
jgi:uncharacterized protein (DUF488 family)